MFLSLLLSFVDLPSCFTKYITDTDFLTENQPNCFLYKYCSAGERKADYSFATRIKVVYNRNKDYIMQRT